MRLPRRRRRDLADRLRLYISTAEPSEPMVDADPIRMFLFRWMVETGDPVEVVARGFELDPQLVQGLVDASVRSLTIDTAETIRMQLRLGPGVASAGLGVS